MVCKHSSRGDGASACIFLNGPHRRAEVLHDFKLRLLQNAVVAMILIPVGRRLTEAMTSCPVDPGKTRSTERQFPPASSPTTGPSRRPRSDFLKIYGPIYQFGISSTEGSYRQELGRI
jgi:hypothetical protein